MFSSHFSLYYNFSFFQVEIVLGLTLRRLTSLESKKINDELEEIKIKKKELEEYLDPIPLFTLSSSSNSSSSHLPSIHSSSSPLWNSFTSNVSPILSMTKGELKQREIIIQEIEDIVKSFDKISDRKTNIILDDKDHTSLTTTSSDSNTSLDSSDSSPSTTTSSSSTSYPSYFFTNLTEEDFISNTKCLILLTKQGYVKRIPFDGSSKSKTVLSTMKDDELLDVLVCSSHDKLFFFSEK